MPFQSVLDGRRFYNNMGAGKKLKFLYKVIFYNKLWRVWCPLAELAIPAQMGRKGAVVWDCV